MTIEVIPAQLPDASVLRNLLQLYMYDFSELEKWDVDAHGQFTYRWLDHYWNEDERHPFLFRVQGHWAGCALVRCDNPTEMAEFFIMRKYRGQGWGQEAAREIFTRFPGQWLVDQMPSNPEATKFWRSAIPVPYTESTTAGGKIEQRFRI